MARARNIKPGFFKNDVLAECDPLARLLFAGLWTEADRDGRLEDRPKRIKNDILGYDDCDIDSLLDQLFDRGFILRYAVDGARYIQILKWDKHQNPHVKEQASEIPAPEMHQTSTVQEQCNTETSTEVAGLIPSSLIPDSLNLIPDSIKESSRKRSDTPSGVCDSVWQDFKKLRKAKKAAITETAIAGIQREANKAGLTLEQALKTCCERGWTGFNADWVTSNAATGETPYQRSMRERFEEASGRKSSNIIDITPPRMEALS